MIKITIEQDGQTPEEFICDQFYLLASNDDKVTERILCETSFLARIAMNMYGYALKVVEQVVNKSKKEQAVSKAIEEVVN